ncbi:MAG TPA: ricin-type beta-trefoil lectin domain protein [Kineosporiaceae bacterium]|nr:ricin-type beta-trefoil lectin domain protein [Kineosporiaceae bacterium]
MVTLRNRSRAARIGLTAAFTGLLTAGATMLALPASADSTAVTGVGSKRCLDVPGVSTTNGAKLTLWNCNGGSNQQWSYNSTTKELQVYGNKCLDGDNHGTVNGTRAVIWDCTGAANQQWNLGSAGTLVGVESGLCLDAAGAGITNGTAVQLWSCNGGDNQRWTGPTATTSPAPTTSAVPVTSAAPTASAEPTASAAPVTSAAPSPAPTTSAPEAMSSMEKQAFDAVNTQRTSNGCAALVIDTSLQKAAHDYAVEMVTTHHFSHTSTSGLSPTDRAKAAGYTRGGVGENAMMGFKGDPNGAVNNPTYGWMSSTGHRANILNCKYTRTGMGYDPGNIDPNYADGSWIQVFG